MSDKDFGSEYWELAVALSAVKAIFPDFWVTSGLCSLTGHCSIGPDYNGPNGQALKAFWPEERFHDGFDADIAPGTVQNQIAAIYDCISQAEKARDESLAGGKVVRPDPFEPGLSSTECHRYRGTSATPNNIDDSTW